MYLDDTLSTLSTLLYRCDACSHFFPKTGHLGGHSSCNVPRFHISIFSMNNNHTQSGLKELTFHPCGSDLKDSNFSYELSTELDVFN